MADGVARVIVEADTSLADAAFKKLQADAERAMDAIGRQRAQAEVTAKVTDFDRSIDNVKRKIAQLDGTTANPNVDIDSTEAQAELAALRLELKKLGSEKATIQVDAKELRDANKLRDISAKKQAQMSKLYLDEQRAIERTAKTRETAAANEQRQIRQTGLMQERAAREDLERTAALAKARRDYGKVLGDVQRIETKTGRPGGIFRSGGEARDLDAAKAKAAGLAREIDRLGGTIEDINPDLERNQGLFSRWGSSLGKTRVQLGLFSATVSQLGKGLIGLGPVLTGLGGGLISVLGVLGSGIAGASAVGAAGLAGFIGSAIGVVAVIKPMVKDFEEAHKASENLAKAQKEYGKNSTQAKSAQEKFNHVMAGTSPAAKAAVKDYGHITEQWKSLTGAAKPAVFNAFGQGIRTVQALLPGFAKQSVATTKTAAHAWDGWMASLRSPESKQLLNTVLSNFRASIPGVAHGLASLGAAFGRITAAASKSLPSLSHGFEDWANKVEASVGGGDALDEKIKNMVHDMQDLGHLTSDTGTLLLHIFGASSKSGDDLVDSLDHVIDKWNTWTQSAEGQSSLKNFFGEARAETEQLFAALSPLTRLLFQMSRAFAPITSGALQAVRVVGDIVAELSKLPGLKVGLEGIGAVLAGVWAVGKVKTFAGAIRDAAGALKGLFAAEGASGGLGALLGLGGAGKAASTVERTGEALIDTGAAASTAGGEVAGFSALLAPEVLVPAAAVGALVLFSTQIANNKSKFEEAAEAYQRSGKQLRDTTKELGTSTASYNGDVNKQTSLNAAAAKAQENLLKVQEKHGVESKQFALAARELTTVENEQVRAARVAGVQRTQSLKQAEKAVTVAREHVKAAREERQAANEKEQGSAGNPTEIYSDPERAQHLAEANKKEAQALREVAAAARAANIAQIPLERQKAHLHALDTETIQGLKQLQPLIGKAATSKIGNFVNPNAVSEITKLSNHLKSVGQGPSVKKIDVKSNGAEQTLGKLKQLDKQTNKVTTARVKIEGNDANANNALKRVSQMAQRLAGSNPVLKILGNSDNAQDAINKLSALARSVIKKEYKAEIKAAWKGGPEVNAALHSVRDAANVKAEAKVKALDQTKAGVASAKGTIKGVTGEPHQAKITAVNATAAGIGQAEAALRAIEHPISVPIIAHWAGVTGTAPSPSVAAHKFAGGSSAYSFAAGGIPSDRELLRAAAQAETRPGGTGGVIRKPTMLVGEQSPTHNEYVITENPAFRSNNENYLAQAAASLGRELIPAYRTGGQSNGKNNGGGRKSSSSNNSQSKKETQDEKDEKVLKHKPPAIRHMAHHYLKQTKVNDHGLVEQQHQFEKQIENAENAYGAELNHEEAEIAAHREHAWNFDKLRGYKTTVKGANEDLKKLYPKMEHKIENEEQRALDAKSKTTAQLGQINPQLSDLEGEYSTMERDKKHESAQDFNKKKRAKKAEINAYKKLKKELLKARKNEEAVIKEAKKALGEIRGTFIPANDNGLLTANDDVNYINDVEQNVIEAPYEEAPKTPAEVAEEQKEAREAVEGNEREGLEAAIVEQEIAGPTHTEQLKKARENLKTWDEGALARARLTPESKDDLEALNNVKSDTEALEGDAAGGTTKSIGEETATLNAARQSLYEQFASNIASRPLQGTAAGQYTPDYAAKVIGGLAASRTTGGGFGTSPTPVGEPPLGSGSTPGGHGGTVMNVTNNFSTPPPDPHTFSKNLTFELNAG